jgi:hypothetical protein
MRAANWRGVSLVLAATGCEVVGADHLSESSRREVSKSREVLPRSVEVAGHDTLIGSETEGHARPMVAELVVVQVGIASM